MGYLVIIDTGHGGVDGNGHYTTAPAKMHKFPDGLTIYEGVINREIGKKLTRRLFDANIPYIEIADDVRDTPLAERVKKADEIYEQNKNSYLLSIHSNAGGGSGFEVFTSIGRTKSDALAQIFCNYYIKNFKGQFPFRKDESDNDLDKESDFYVLRKPDCPAVLVENLFFDNRKEAEYLLSEEGQIAIADCLFEAIQDIESSKPI